MPRYIVEAGVCVSPRGDDNGTWYVEPCPLIDAACPEDAFAIACLKIKREHLNPDSIVHIFPYYVSDHGIGEDARDNPLIAAQAKASAILKEWGLPVTRLGALALMALAGLGPDGNWSKVTRSKMRPHDILTYIATYFGVRYAENSRETLRDALAGFVSAGIAKRNPGDPRLLPRSPKTNYALDLPFVESLTRRCDHA